MMMNSSNTSFNTEDGPLTVESITNSIDALDPSSSQPLSNPPTECAPNQSEIINGPPTDTETRRWDQGTHSLGPLPIRLLMLSTESENELWFGLNQLAQDPVRNNLHFIDLEPCPTHDDVRLNAINHSLNRSRSRAELDKPHAHHKHHHPWTPSTKSDDDQHHDHHLHHHNQDLPSEYWWFIKIKHDPHLIQNEYSIKTSHSNFSQLSNTSSTYLIDCATPLFQSTPCPTPQPYSDRFLVTITYKRKCEAFRAIGHLLAMTRLCPRNPDHQQSDLCKQIVQGLSGRIETCSFQTLGLMIDCSRNGVLNLDRCRQLIRFIALMGLNVLQLYTEDTYQIEDEPFFGYFRGPYSQAELKQIDDYAHELGIEVIPCIQTLGHLGQMLQWPKYGAMRDTHEVLLVDSQEVYQFIEKMITSITGPLRSKRIHIGMDEAHGVSEGRYRQIFGHKESTQVFTDHLKRVNQICAKLELKPMIWSDMLFCLAANSNSLNGYYDSLNPATPELVQAIPPEIELVYWDYYHTTSAPYINKISQHRDLNYKPPIMASGIWTWSRFWTALPFTIETVRASMRAIKDPKSGITNALTTVWGDEGAECDIWSALPGILYYSEHAYTRKDEVDVPLLKLKFDGIVGGSFDDFIVASKLDDLHPHNQPIDENPRFTPNLSKWLLWEEPFYSILSPQYSGHDLESHYEELSRYMEEATTIEKECSKKGRLNEHPMNVRLRFPLLISKVLMLKCHLRDRLVKAYEEKDIDELRALAGNQEFSRLSKLKKWVEELWMYHREMWMIMYKPFGWEVLDLRYGGLRARLETMQGRLNGYLDPKNSKITKLEELEVQAQVVYPTSGTIMMLDYHRVSRPQYC